MKEILSYNICNLGGDTIYSPPKRRRFMKTKKLLAAVLATMLVLTAVMLVACNNTDDMSNNIYEGKYATVADEKAVEQLQADVQKLSTDSTDKDGKPVAQGYRLAISVKGKTDMKGVPANIDGTFEGLVTTDEKQNVSAQLSLKLSATATNPETNKEESILSVSGNAWAFTETNRGYADFEMEAGGTKMSGKYYADLKELINSGIDINIADIIGKIDPEEAMQEFQAALKDTNTKIYVDGDNKYKVETTMDGQQATVYLYKTNDGKLCVKMETIADGINVSVDMRPTQSKVSMPKDTSEYKKFDGNINF